MLQAIFPISFSSGAFTPTITRPFAPPCLGNRHFVLVFPLTVAFDIVWRIRNPGCAIIAVRSHTSQMTASVRVHYPPNNGVGSTRGASAAAGTRQQEQQEAGIMGYIKSIWNS